MTTIKTNASFGSSSNVVRPALWNADVAKKAAWKGRFTPSLSLSAIHSRTHPITCTEVQYVRTIQKIIFRARYSSSSVVMRPQNAAPNFLVSLLCRSDTSSLSHSRFFKFRLLKLHLRKPTGTMDNNIGLPRTITNQTTKCVYHESAVKSTGLRPVIVTADIAKYNEFIKLSSSSWQASNAIAPINVTEAR
eukprot:CAMPEP_0172942988 /NCGR_PEP_ID=MMETSP1075-20121228/225322_1 /TAXON_ID=2916 /ORGANISM="Ceratium fusus, Strain PA161109" /LENGTH=190 /DNA_ID=CAMNT_0013804413 /DNA_START=989 /DNA_END=1561 /DNA_ORIENTATION=+